VESRIKIKFGPIEVEFEGTEKFLKEELSAVLDAIRKLYETSGLPPVNTADFQSPSNGGTVDKSLTVSAAAKKLGVKTGPELAVAAAAILVLVQGKATFSRSELLEEMKRGVGHFEETYRKNLTNTLISLTKSDKFRSMSKNQYALSSETHKELEQKLGSQGQS
jgi:hypothetical protein